MRTILLLSGGRFNVSILADIFWLKSFRKNGYRTIYMVRKKNNAAELADRHFFVDNWSYDEIKQLVIKEKIVFIFHLSDSAGAVVARLNDEFNLPGIRQHQYRYLHDKSIWPTLLQESNLGVSKTLFITQFEHFDENAEDWNKPIIVKATASSSSITDKPYGYKFYSSLADFKKYLIDNSFMESFLIDNCKGTEYGKYLIQEKIIHKQYFFVNVIVVGGKLVFQEVEEHKVYTDSMVHYETFGPTDLPDRLKEHSDLLLGLFINKLGLCNAYISFDIIEDSRGNIVTQDINSRLGTRWCASLNYRDADIFGSKIINDFIDVGNYNPSKILSQHSSRLRPYMIKHFDFTPGQIESVVWGEVDHSNYDILGKHALMPGANIVDIRKQKFPTRMIVSDESIGQCINVFNAVSDNITIEYA